jgi:hypothetical protein
MPNDRNIFADDKKLMHLCEDFLHQIEQMKEEAKNDPDKYPTPTRLIEVLRYEDDPIPLDMEEYQQLAFFIGDEESGHAQYAEWKRDIIEQSTLGLLNEDGSSKDSLIFGE